MSAITGAGRGELVVAIQFDCLDLDNKRVELRSNYVWSKDGLIFKDTKTHQIRFVSLDDATLRLLEKHRHDCAQQLLSLGLPLTGKEFVFSKGPDRSTPRDPSSISHRYCRLMRRLGIDSELRHLRHDSATELLTAGVDLRTVAGRLAMATGLQRCATTPRGSAPPTNTPPRPSAPGCPNSPAFAQRTDVLRPGSSPTSHPLTSSDAGHGQSSSSHNQAEDHAREHTFVPATERR